MNVKSQPESDPNIPLDQRPLPQRFPEYCQKIQLQYPIKPRHRWDIENLFKRCSGLGSEYHIFDKIGEGTFSTVYKAVDLKHFMFDNSYWDFDFASEEDTGNAFIRPPPKFVAIKKIYVTSSCNRIENEISILHQLVGNQYVTPLITATRFDDQVLLVLPFFRHVDFREYFQTLPLIDIKYYMFSLFQALSHCHRHKIIHRDVKPSNFLYLNSKRRGVLVDFGLAQREEPPTQEIPEFLHTKAHSFFDANGSPGIIKNDTRPTIKANRAGTRGFRAPEVLLKCRYQTVSIDVWSAGVILLCFMSRRFPFFNSASDHEALIELACIFGKTEMQKVSTELNRVFHTNIPSIREAQITFPTLCKNLNPEGVGMFPPEAFDLLEKCLALNPKNRITADQALLHPFLAGLTQ
ncbi:kinase-like protein [Conidiobolus coronatus NRRL 28638]|uniref:non-specific serine/threonine protein kinase n=1 Tax=Conidiobolus coronatus (strain ATCC 28846 / CBS 209.66 / NRRL 28638) TaxID=796925 RepID=A0A137NZI2_CONC2|nr:kinase-like protein [Conidiobolus coronatus NRRL 28638]|eukprot:KXN68142.1 kinase-like protein [Conidiobolus coronatus NRRL 28638]